MAFDSRPPARHLAALYGGTYAVLWALLLLCHMQPTLLSNVTGVQLVLTNQTGCSTKHEVAAIFTCTVPLTGVNITKLTVNWYAAYDGSGEKKIADSVTKVSGKLRTSLDLDMGTAQLNITTLDKNDSGIYYCQLIRFRSRSVPVDSNKVWLNVTDMETPCPESQMNDVNSQALVILVVSLGALAMLCGLVVFVILKRRRGNTKAGSAIQHTELEPQSAPVYSLEYAALDFQLQKKAERLREVHAGANVEYATIVFPPSLPEARDWR